MDYTWIPHPTEADTYIYNWEIIEKNGKQIMSWFHQMSFSKNTCIHYYEYGSIPMDEDGEEDSERDTTYFHFCGEDGIHSFINMLIKMKELVHKINEEEQY